MDQNQVQNNETKTNWSDLQKELKFDILSRLSVLDLGKCKCVAREWMELISEPFFLNMHHTQASQSPKLFLLEEPAILVDDHGNEIIIADHVCFSSLNMEGEVDYRVINPTQNNINMIPSGHGLICLIYNEHFFSLNPSTRNLMRLPNVQPSTTGQTDVGFGYNPTTNEYKLVHLFDTIEDADEHEIRAELLTITEGGGTGTWKVIDATCPFFIEGLGVMANNRFYWIISAEYEYINNEIIMSLDLGTELYDAIPHPHIQSYLEGNDTSLVVIERQLYLIDTFAYPTVTDIWKLEDHEGRIWQKLYRIDLGILEGFDDELTRINILGYQEGKFIIDCQQETLVFYDVKKKIFEKGKSLNLRWDTKMCLYIDTFFSSRNI